MKRLTSLVLTLSLVLGACGQGSQDAGGNLPPEEPPVQGEPAAASQVVKLKVPEGMSYGLINDQRQLTVPPGFDISVYARVPKARFLAAAPNGDVLVSQPSTGSILLLRPDGQGAATVSTFASGLRRAHDMVFKTLDGKTYLYVAETHQVTRSVYQPGDTSRRQAEVIVSGLPDGDSGGELNGQYGHALKNIAIDDAGKLYVSIASASDADPARDPRGIDPERGAIHVYDARKPNQDAASGELFARGIRNAEGLTFAPGTNDLWIVVMNRDNVLYPHKDDYDGDGTTDYKELIPDYVDKNPPEEIIRVKQGGDYGWPFCNPDPRGGLNSMPYLPDVQNNEGERVLDCDQLIRVDKGMPAHSAPLGVTFWNTANGAYRNVMTVGLHGCWNCQEYVGYEVAMFPLKADGTLGAQQDLVTGWLTDTRNPGNMDCSKASSVAGKDVCWGRPVDTAPLNDGSLLISDDYSGTIYRLFRK